ncbi:hypothetical protein B8W95_14155, partial [Staphylococcus pasteuri]
EGAGTVVVVVVVEGTPSFESFLSSGMMFAGSGKKLGSLSSQLQRQGNSKRASVDESSPGVCPQKNKMTK